MPKPESLRACAERLLRDRMGDLAFGYAFEDRLPTFRRPVTLEESSAVQLIELQAGTKMGSFGFFTVTLGVYSPALTHPPRGVEAARAHSWHCMAPMWTRLGALIPPEARSADNWTRQRLDGVKDQWWPYNGERTEVERVFVAVSDHLERYGLPWLDSMSTSDAFRAARAAFEAAASRTLSVKQVRAGDP